MMSEEVLLDPQGDLPAPTGYQVINTEVDFLRYATEDIPLLVRGQRLCAWAESFCHLRGRPYHYQESLSAVLQRSFPNLSQQQAARLAHRIGVQTAPAEPVSAASVLNSCYPEAYTLWQGTPSIEHAAHWLLWLCANSPDDAESILLKRLANSWEHQLRDSPESTVYRAVNPKQAELLLRRWLGVAEPELDTLGEFPLEVPAPMLKEIRSAWLKRIIGSNGAYFPEMLTFPLSIGHRQELAQLTATFLEENPAHLTYNLLCQIRPYLSTASTAALQQRLPPPEPTSMPQDPLAVLEWFRTDYLPYRRWQAHFGEEDARKCVVDRAQVFAQWYLSRYPSWLFQPGWLSYQNSASLFDSHSEYLTLCVVLDGLPAWDAEDFARDVSARIERLQLQAQSYCFAPLPTVTEFAKDALLKGVPPRLAPQYSPMGTVVPDGSSPLPALQDAGPGQVVFWRVAQPDAAYHFETHDKRARQVGAELEVIVKTIQQIVEGLPARLPLQIIVTSDHGRLLNPKSRRCLSVPEGMEAHGRVAWGRLHQVFEDNGFAIDESSRVIAIHGDRFEMAYDMVIAWGEESFLSSKGGFDPYPHGGLFPEEAIVPWFVFMRDAELPDLDITVTGKGEAGNSGELMVNIANPGRVALECLAISLSTGLQMSGNWPVSPLSQASFTVPANPWPAKADLQSLRAELLFRQPNGATFRRGVAPELIVRSLYERDDSIFEELEL